MTGKPATGEAESQEVGWKHQQRPRGLRREGGGPRKQGHGQQDGPPCPTQHVPGGTREGAGPRQPPLDEAMFSQLQQHTYTREPEVRDQWPYAKGTN